MSFRLKFKWNWGQRLCVCDKRREEVQWLHFLGYFNYSECHERWIILQHTLEIIPWSLSSLQFQDRFKATQNAADYSSVVHLVCEELKSFFQLAYSSSLANHNGPPWSYAECLIVSASFLPRSQVVLKCVGLLIMHFAETDYHLGSVSLSLLFHRVQVQHVMCSKSC